jgi:hypothetical protein
MEERRKLERFRLCLPAKLVFFNKNQEVLQLGTRDISSDGAFLITDISVPEGSPITLEFLLPVEQFRQLFNEKRNVSLKIKGHVIRKEASGLAVQFEKKYEIGSLDECGNKGVPLK